MTLPISSGGRRYGRKRDTHDSRDYKFKMPATFPTLPPMTTNRLFVGPVKNQGSQSSCTAHGWSSLWELEYRKFLKQTPVFSPRFVYYLERDKEGSLPADDGAETRTGAQIITEYGICLEATDPYDNKFINVAPAPDQLAEALKYKSGAYHRLVTLLDIKCCLADQGDDLPGHPFVLGMMVPASFEGPDIRNNGLMPMPKPGEAILGGHLVLAVDYDDTIQCPRANPGAVLVQNSWGTEWGVDASVGTRGFFWMPYDFISDPDKVSDMWMCHYGKPWIPKAA